MDDKQGPHTVVRRPADSRPVERQHLHLRLADSRRLEGLLLKKAHNALSPADLMQSVGRTLCSQPDLPYAVSPADLTVSVEPAFEPLAYAYGATSLQIVLHVTQN